MRGKTIAILGVDGTGKSTIIKAIANNFGNNCIIKYMGHRDFGDGRIKSRPESMVDVLRNVYFTYLCYRKRYREATAAKKIAIFDRYVDEVYINSHGKWRVVYTILYKYLFPRPDLMIYLYCPTDISLLRKKDIEDRNLFDNMRRRFDGVYKNNKKCLCIDTAAYSVDECTQIAVKYITQRIDNGKY